MAWLVASDHEARLVDVRGPDLQRGWTRVPSSTAFGG